MKTIEARAPTNRKTKAAKLPVLELAPIRLALKKILVPTDFSEESLKAIRYAIRFAEQFAASVTLVHVFEPITYPVDMGYVPVAMQTHWDSLRASTTQRLEGLAKQELKASVQGDTIVRCGSAFNEIVTVAKDLNIDLIIIATHGYGGLKHLVMGSTAERVVRHAPCPVLVVRDREHDFIESPNESIYEKQSEATAERA
jgi:universal stress protein A